MKGEKEREGGKRGGGVRELGEGGLRVKSEKVGREGME